MNITQPANPIIDEITASPVYHQLVEMLQNYQITRIYDCHAHVSSGRGEGRGRKPEASPLQPKTAFAVSDINRLYDRLFRDQGIAVTTVVFDTPLPVYNMTEKNDKLLREASTMSPAEAAKVVPFAVITPEMPSQLIDSYVKRGARGFKMTPRTALAHPKRGTISDITLGEMLNPHALRIAHEYGLPMVIHLPQLVVAPRMKPALRDELGRIVTQYPNARFVLAHLGQAQTPGKLEDLLAWIGENDLGKSIWMDISAVTVPSVLELAFSGNVRLLFGTDIDFSLTERGKYLMFKYAEGQRVLANGDDRGGVITALVSTSFGDQLKEFAAQREINLDAPMMIFQFQGILEAIENLRGKGRSEAEIKRVLQDIFYRNAEALLDRRG